MKVCTKCGKKKSKPEFYRARCNQDGLTFGLQGRGIGQGDPFEIREQKKGWNEAYLEIEEQKAKIRGG